MKKYHYAYGIPYRIYTGTLPMVLVTLGMAITIFIFVLLHKAALNSEPQEIRVSQRVIKRAEELGISLEPVDPQEIWREMLSRNSGNARDNNSQRSKRRRIIPGLPF